MSENSDSEIALGGSAPVHLSVSELGARWKRSGWTLGRWRKEGIGPSYKQILGKVLYELSVIEDFEKQRTVTVNQSVSCPKCGASVADADEISTN